MWGNPPSRFYRLLQIVEAAFPVRSLSIAILGCSDGKFVLPAARRGHRVLAIDIDRVALFGGEKPGVGGVAWMPGLVARLQQEKLHDRVNVIEADFVGGGPPQRAAHLAVTSGSIQYSRNLRHSVRAIVASIQSYVRPRGYLYVDYMLPTEEKHRERENFLVRGALRALFPATEWQILYDRVLPPQPEKAHVDNPVDHFHHWGHLLARRQRAPVRSRVDRRGAA
jgi:SAM-dependent methyltransferase